MEIGFRGSVPELYESQLGPVLFAPYARDLAQRVPPRAREILEIAAGTGRVTREIVNVLAEHATLIATDLNEPMIEQGRLRVTDPRVRWERADAQALPFQAARFDVVACQFGLMFVPDKLLAMREMRRVTSIEGTLVLSTWRAIEHNAAQHLVQRLVEETFPVDPPRFLETPFSMPDAGSLAELAHAAGFADVQVEIVACVADASSAAELSVGLVRGTPLWHQLVERGVDAAAFEAEVTERLIQRFGDRPCRSPLSANVLTAVA